jgi:glycosyltransferase involved in cell wall biosynthesis
MSKKISIITPFYNEEQSISDYFSCIEKIFSELKTNYEIIAVDDGSKDQTHSLLKKFSLQNPNLKIVKLSRNFGKEIALTAGLDFASGDGVIPLDADLQDSPEAIPEMIKKWQEGYKVVIAQRTDRKDSLLKKITAYLFYKLAAKVMDSKIPKNVGDFRLIDRIALESIKQLRERNRFMRGILSWVGYETAVVEYQRSARKKGKTKYNYKSMIKYALDGIFSFSTFPIRLITYCGFFISCLSFLYGFAIVIGKLFFDKGIPGYASIMSVMLFLSGINFIFIGVIGEYVGRIFTEVKQRPLYVVEELTGLNKQS